MSRDWVLFGVAGFWMILAGVLIRDGWVFALGATMLGGAVVALAPLGYEDDDGFHYGDEGDE